MKTKLFTFLFLLYAFTITAQTTLQGKITAEETGEALPFGTITLHKKGVLLTGTQTDLEGHYIFNSIDTGTYEIEVSYVGYGSQKVVGIEVQEGKTNTCNIKMGASVTLDEVEVLSYHYPRKERDKSVSSSIVTIEEVMVRGVSSSKAKRQKKKNRTKKTSPPKDTEKIRIRGSREESGPEYINGMKVVDTELNDLEEDFIEGSGQLTAGEWNDLDNWESWIELITEDFVDYAAHWQYSPTERYAVQVQANDQRALPNCILQLVDSDKKVLWETKTDNQGKAELWSNLFTKGAKAKKIIASYKEMSITLDLIKPFEKGINKVQFPIGCIGANSVDIGFVVDATSSMKDELAYLKAELKNVIERVQQGNPELFIRTGTVFYRDTEDEYLSRIDPLNDNISTTLNFIKKQYAMGGGDTPEAVEVALDKTINELDWNPDAIGRIVFLILDAPPHHRPDVLQKMQTTIRQAAKLGIKIIPVSASGIDKSTEYLLKTLAITTNATYTFLTDDSGIGDKHLEPTAGVFDVVYLNDLMVELVQRYIDFEDCEEIETQKPDDPLPFFSNNVQLLQYVEVFPNPATDFVTIKVQDNFDKLIIKNALGQTVKTFNLLEKGQQTLQLGSWAPGIYFLEFRKDKEYVLEKLVIQSAK